eukprot:11931505-Heterocapsa_arctica.AAC.1
MMFGGEMCGEMCPEPDVDGADEVEVDRQARERRGAGEAASNLTGPAGHSGGGAGRQSARAQWRCQVR